MNITLNQNEYNAVYQLLNAITGKHAVTALKLIDQIRSKVDEGKAKEIDLAVETYELESVLQGIKVLAESDKSTVNDLGFFTYVAGLLKVKGAWNKILDNLIEKTATVAIDSDIELDA